MQANTAVRQPTYGNLMTTHSSQADPGALAETENYLHFRFISKAQLKALRLDAFATKIFEQGFENFELFSDKVCRRRDRSDQCQTRSFASIY